MLDNAYNKNSENHEPDNGGNAANHNDPRMATQAVVRSNSETPRFVAPTHSGVDILKLLSELEDLVENTPKRLGIMFRFDDEKFHYLIMKIRANLPEEMKRASKLVRETERLQEETRENAERLLAETRDAAISELEGSKHEATRLREEAQNEIVRARQTATQEAQRIQEEARLAGEALVAKAREQVAQMISQGEAYASQVTREGEAQAAEVVTQGQAQAAQLLTEGQTRAAQLVSDNVIVQQAQALAQDIQARADDEAAAVRQGADDYARDVLANLEAVLGKAVTQIQRGREMLERGD